MRIQKELKWVFETVVIVNTNNIVLAMDNELSFMNFYIWFYLGNEQCALGKLEEILAFIFSCYCFHFCWALLK